MAPSNNPQQGTPQPRRQPKARAGARGRFLPQLLVLMFCASSPLLEADDDVPDPLTLEQALGFDGATGMVQTAARAVQRVIHDADDALDRLVDCAAGKT